MTPQLRWKFAFISAVIVVCLFGLFGFPNSLAQVAQNFKNRIQLGLDLRGGSHMVLQVEVPVAIRQRTYQTIDDLKKQLRAKNVNVGDVQILGDTQILVKNVDPATSGTFRDVVTQFQDWTLAPAAGQPNGYVLTMKNSAVSDLQQQTMQQARETINRRINELGLTEPTVAPVGTANEILVELPGEGDPTRAKEVIQAGGQLAFQKVLDPQPYPSEAAALSAHNGVLPPDSELVPGASEGGAPGEPQSQVYYLLQRSPIITGADLRCGCSAVPSGDYPGQYQVNFTVSTVAASRLGPFTAANIGQRMAIVLDNKVESAPEIQARIDDSGRITGNFSQESAQNLALVLRSGALPAPIKYLQEETIGPSLGVESIREGVRASVGSLLAVMIFLVIYYRLAGVNAVVALILNLVILMAFMGLSGAVLTLPGIAGVVLTIGMGVDSNVLVFERIREELRAGKAPGSAVDVGFERAFLTIIDTHITTLVSAAFLFLFGTGPVRGFAVTLIVGLLANLFTSIYVSRAIFDLHLARMPRQAELSI